MPFFSIIIPTYNRYYTLKKAIESVLTQTFTDFELLIVDDGSTDETSQIEYEYRDSLVYIKQDNRGVSSARNTGIKNSVSPYLAFLDSDDVWIKEKLEKQSEFIRKNPHISINQTDEIWIRNGIRVNPMKKHQKKEGDIFFPSLELCLISPSCVVIKREIFETYGLFDESMPVCEDYDLWLRITEKEYIGLIKEKLVIKYGGHSCQLSKMYWGMDRYRLYSLLKLLKDYETTIDIDRKDRVVDTVKKKCEILLNGASKRGNDNFADILMKIIYYLKNQNYSRRDLEILLEKLQTYL
ncbi:MAG: glycosyltransferase family A protein [Spirochaetota bacterium]|nr:glycosyltransferase family A protein [Spirochaetota bacterium]